MNWPAFWTVTDADRNTTNWNPENFSNWRIILSAFYLNWQTDFGSLNRLSVVAGFLCLYIAHPILMPFLPATTVICSPTETVISNHWFVIWNLWLTAIMKFLMPWNPFCVTIRKPAIAGSVPLHSLDLAVSLLTIWDLEKLCRSSHCWNMPGLKRYPKLSIWQKLLPIQHVRLLLVWSSALRHLFTTGTVKSSISHPIWKPCSSPVPLKNGRNYWHTMQIMIFSSLHTTCWNVTLPAMKISIFIIRSSMKRNISKITAPRLHALSAAFILLPALHWQVHLLKTVSVNCGVFLNIWCRDSYILMLISAQNWNSRL